WFEPAFTARNSPPSAAGRAMAHSIARAISLTSMSGRHGVPSLRMRMVPVATAVATKSFSTRSRRNRGLLPQAVAKRRQVIEKSPPASRARAHSAEYFERAYAVRGFTAEDSVRAPSSAKPYTEQDEAKTNEVAPARRALAASATVAS